MANNHAVIVRPVGNRIRVTSSASPRFCVEADTREKAIELALEAVRYIDSVKDIKYEPVQPEYEVELLCA